MEATDILKLSKEVNKSQRETKVLDRAVNQINNERVADIYVRNVRKFQEFEEPSIIKLVHKGKEVKEIEIEIPEVKKQIEKKKLKETRRKNLLIAGLLVGGLIVGGGIATGITYTAVTNSQRHQTKNKIVNNSI